MASEVGIVAEGVQTLDSPTFTFPKIRDWTAEIVAALTPTFWLSVELDRVTLSNPSVGNFVISGVGRNGTAYTGGPSPRGPSLAAQSINGRPALNFPNASERKFIEVPSALPWAGDFSVLAVVRLQATEAPIRTLLRTSGAGNPLLTIVCRSDTQDRVDVTFNDESGDQARSLTVVGSLSDGGVGTVVILVNWSDAANTLSVSLDTGRGWSQDFDPLLSMAGLPASNIRIGATDAANNSLIGDVADLLIAPFDLRASANASKLTLLRQYLLGRFLLDFT